MSAQYITLDSIITDYLTESEQSEHKYFKLYNIGFRGMDELGLDFFYRVKTVKLPVDANKTAKLPADFINYTKVGVLNTLGEVIPLFYNSRLTNFGDLFSDRQSRTTDNTLFNWYQWNSPIFYNYWNGFGFVNMYGFPSGSPFVGSYKMDYTNQVILLNEQFFYDYVLLEYIAAPQQGNEYFVPIQFREAMISYLRWKDVISMNSTSHINLGEKQQRRHEFFNDRRLAWARYKPTSLEEAYEKNLQNQRLTVKS